MRTPERSAALAAVCVIALLGGCVGQAVVQDGIVVNDPFEENNRRVHDFNKALDQRIIAPIARRAGSGGATAASDHPGAMDMVMNAGANLSLPGKTLNSALQGRPGPAIHNMLRFAVNTTIGIGGLFDPADNGFGLQESDTDFGETLAVWGVPEGAYMELPVLGPSTQRDTVGKIVDVVIDPLGLVLNTDEMVLAYGLRAASKAGDRARFGDTVDSILQDSADSYAQTRLIWLMHRRHELGETGAEIDPYDDAADAIDPYAE